MNEGAAMQNYDILFPLNHQKDNRFVSAQGNVLTDEEGREFVDMDDRSHRTGLLCFRLRSPA